MSGLRGFIQCFRSYATATKRVTLKAVDSRKTFLIDTYTDLMRNNQIVLFVHRNNLLKADDAVFRQQIEEAGGKFQVINNNLMKVYLRSQDEEDPASKESSIKNSKVKHPLFPLLHGPTAVIAFKDNDPSKVKKIYKVLKSAKERLFVIGAKVDKEVYDLSTLDWYKELPNKEQLQAQLVGLLNMCGGLGLTKTLESGRNMLYLTLKSHKTKQEEK